jgi:CubicO group peptidase (beta-lactamase class C family)
MTLHGPSWIAASWIAERYLGMVSVMSGPVLSPTADSSKLGFDPVRLQRMKTRFDRTYLDSGLLPGYAVAITRQGEVAHTIYSGKRDLESGAPIEADTIYRMYSNTKPITAVAALMLWEEGAFELTDPIAKYIPEFANTRVYVKGSAAAPITQPLIEPIRIWHLLSHTAGLTYGFMHTHPVDLLYRQAGYEWGTPPDTDLAAACTTWASLPLVFQPGTEWNYSVGTDVIGRLIEVISGMKLDEFFRTRIFSPLSMPDTSFGVPADKVDRLAALYFPTPGTKKAMRLDAMGNAALDPNPTFLSGGGGLVSTLHDYVRFQLMLIGGGQLDGVRLLSPHTIKMMASNHLPGGGDLESVGRPLFAETNYTGVGFGLAVSVTLDPAATKTAGSPGDYGWGGAASTWMMIDPKEELTVMFMTQLLPSSTHPIRSQIRPLLYQALIE